MKQRFRTADEAIAWYNAWLRTATPPRDMEGCRECDEEYGGWDPVIKWYLQDGRPIYWYIVGTGNSESLVIEGEDTIRSWGNQYYHYFAANEGRDRAEALLRFASLPEKAPPADLEPSTPESVYWARQGIAEKGNSMATATRSGFPTRTFRFGDIAATVEHLGEAPDEEPPHQMRDRWKITVRGPAGQEYEATIGGSRDEYQRRRDLREKRTWGGGPLEQVLYELNWAAEDPQGWAEFEEVEADPGRKEWDPRASEAQRRADEFLAIAKRFDGVIQPAYELWQANQNEIVTHGEES